MTSNENRYPDSHTWKEILSQPTVWKAVIAETSTSSLIGNDSGGDHRQA